VYLEKGYIDPDQLNSDGLYVDDHDGHALHIAAFSADEMIGTFRLIFRDGSDGLLPVEELFDIHLPGGAAAVEPSGLAVLKEHRSYGHQLAFVGLLRGIFELAVEHRAVLLCPVLEIPMIRWLQLIGFPVEIISESRTVYNTENLAVCCPVDGLIETIENKDRSRFLKYGPLFAEPFDGWLTEDRLRNRQWEEA
jgi:N-acyl-L-homoserine lactone synthetase